MDSWLAKRSRLFGINISMGKGDAREGLEFGSDLRCSTIRHPTAFKVVSMCSVMPDRKTGSHLEVNHPFICRCGIVGFPKVKDRIGPGQQLVNRVDASRNTIGKPKHVRIITHPGTQRP